MKFYERQWMILCVTFSILTIYKTWGLIKFTKDLEANLISAEWVKKRLNKKYQQDKPCAVPTTDSEYVNSYGSIKQANIIIKERHIISIECSNILNMETMEMEKHGSKSRGAPKISH